MRELVLKNRAGNYAEVFIDYNIETFQYDYEINNERSISFTAFKTVERSDMFDMLTNENYIIYEGQQFVIKSSAIKYDSQIVLNEIVAKHIFMEFQNHYVEKDIENEELNNEVAESEDENSDLDPTLNYTLKQYLDFAFKNNPLGFTYEIVGDINRRAPVEELGGQNGMEYIVAGAELFGYIYFADNKKIYFYQPDSFYQRANTPIIYRHNSDELSCTIVTTDMKTYGKGYGKKKTKTETKAYTPIKTPKLKLSGTYSKEGTWWTSTVGGYYEKTFTCKWGNEQLVWTRKKASLGGKVDVYLDGEKISSFEQYRKTAKTDSIVIAKNLEKGEHTFRVVFRGAISGVNYKGKSPRMYIGTEKTTILNLTAVLKGADVYYAETEYYSPNYKIFGHMQAPTLFTDALTKNDVTELLKESINDEPTIELETNYLGDMDDRHYIIGDDIKENSLVRFIHKPLGWNTDLKVVKFTKYHPDAQKANVVEFSNAKADIIDIQTQMNMRIKRANSTIAQGNFNVDTNVVHDFYGDALGSVLVDE